MAQDGSDLERRLTEIQSQINRLSLSLHLWRERQDRLAPIETRVAAPDLKAQQEATQELREQAAALTEVALKVATSAASSHDRTELRLAAIEGDLHHTLADLSGQLTAVVAELRTLTKPAQNAIAGQTPTWPLDGVVRLHNQLRDVDAGAAPADASLAAAPDRRRLPEAPSDLVERLEILERAMNEQHDDAGVGRMRMFATAAVALLVVGFLGAGLLVVRMQRHVEATTARMTESQQLAEAATQAANRQIAAAREDAMRQIAEARETALKAQTISDVLAAPDLVRYNLVGRMEAREATGPSTAQALWSRSRGLVFSGSRLPPPPADSTYQIWLLTPADAVSVGTFVPDANGRFTMATNTPPRVPPPLSGISVTVERSGGSERPTGATVLARAEIPVER